MSFTNVFTSSTIYASEVSLTKLNLTGNVQLYWPLEANPDVPLASKIVEIDSADASNYIITLPDATLASVGETILFNNLSNFVVVVSNNAGTQIIAIPSSTEFQVYLADNTTQAGVWRQYQFGATTSQANASALAGAGLQANGSLLDQKIQQINLTTDTTLTSADRAEFFNWNGALGNLTLPVATVVGNNWFVHVRNSGTGNLNILVQASELINETTTLALTPTDSATIITDGTDFYTVGLGQSATYAFNYVVVDVTGSVDYVLSGSELNQVAYQFIGTLGADINIIVPSTTQQYWVFNNTTGGFNLGLATATQVSPLILTNGLRTINYCDSSVVVSAVTATVTGVINGGTF
jgi:hypothetical protein